jgi:DNA-binding MarR family transcriptional regulator
MTTTPTTGTSSDASGPVPSNPTRWLDDLEMDAWLAYIETHNDLDAALERDLAPTGLTLGDYQVFVYLSNADGQAMRMCDLAEMLQLSPSGLTRRLDGLVRAGWVERRSSHDDRRVMLAVLTDEGRRRLEAAAPHHVASVRARMIDLLEPEELRAIAAAFRKIRAAIDDERGRSTPAMRATA